MGKGIVGFVTLYAIQTLLLPKPVVKHLKFQSGIFNCNSQKLVYLLKCKICGEAPYVAKAKKMKFRARFNNFKSTHRPCRKKTAKYHSSVFMNITGNTVIMGLMIGSSH